MCSVRILICMSLCMVGHSQTVLPLSIAWSSSLFYWCVCVFVCVWSLFLCVSNIRDYFG